VSSTIADPNIGGSGNIGFPETILNSFSGPLMNTNVPESAIIPFFWRSMAVVTGNGPLAFAVSAKPTGIYNPPLAPVELYGRTGAGDWILLGTATGPVTTGDGVALNRRHTWSFTWNPGTSFGANTVVNLIAVDATANGDALRVLAAIAITVQN
jgi:hypothetical protein